MTINHASAVWGYGGTPSLATINGQQGGYRGGRLFTAAPATAGASAGIRPYVVPWTASADSFGVAFPSGLVGVTEAISLPSPLGGTINAGFESQWAGLLASIIPVPAVLPGGYTASLQTDWRSLTASLTRIRTAAGFTDKTWLPTTTPNGSTIGPVTLVGSGGVIGLPNAGYMIWATAKTGYRKVQVKFRTGQQWLTMPSYTQTCTLSHNANGSSPGTSAVGDTIDATLTTTDAAFTNVGSFWWETGWFDLGAIQASSIGTLTTFQIKTDSNSNPTAMDNGLTIQWRLSPRCDVPYPISVAGQGDLIAPGGYP